jgi:hypothetical protein
VRDGWIRTKYEGVKANAIDPKQASSRRDDGGSDGGDGGDGGGRQELLSYYCTGGRHGSRTSRSGVTNLSSHNYYCRQYYLFTLILLWSSSSHETPCLLGTSHSTPTLKFSTKDAGHS